MTPKTTSNESKMSPSDAAFIRRYTITVLIKNKSDESFDSFCEAEEKYPRLAGILNKLTPEDMNHLLTFIDL